LQSLGTMKDEAPTEELQETPAGETWTTNSSTLLADQQSPTEPDAHTTFTK